MTESIGPVYLTEADVAELVTINDAVEALQELLPKEPSGQALNIPKTLGAWEPRSTAHALGAVATDDGLALFQTWVNTPRGATAHATLFDAAAGTVLAVIEATTLGAIRTAAISGLATRWLSVEDAEELALIGSGRQALAHIAAVAATRPLRCVRVYSRTPDRLMAFVARADAAFPFEVRACSSVRECVAGAAIISLLTRAQEPFLFDQDLTGPVHVNAVGAILPAGCEIGADVVEAAELIVVDSVANVRGVSRELRDHFGSEPAGWDGVRSLGELIASGAARDPSARLTLFKSVGMGLSDLAVAKQVWRKARTEGVGRQMGRSKMAEPRWDGSHTAGAAVKASP